MKSPRDQAPAAPDAPDANTALERDVQPDVQLDMQMMEWLDDELHNGDRAAMAQRIDQDRELAARAEGVRAVGALVRGHLELSADEAEARLARAWDQVAKRLDAEAAPALIPQGQTHGKKVSAAPSLWTRMRGYLVASVVGAAATAAIALLIARAGGPPSPAGSNLAVGPGREIAAPVDPRLAPVTPPIPEVMPVVLRAPEVESLDTPGASSVVLTLEDEDGGTAVIWVTPDDLAELEDL